MTVQHSSPISRVRPVRSRALAALGVVAALALLATAAPAAAVPGLPTLDCPPGLERVGAVRGMALCSHGDDTHLDDAHLDDHGHHHVHAEAAATASNASTGPIPAADPACYGDGSDGSRVQVLYAHEQSTPDRSGQLAVDLRRWVGQAEWTVNASARRSGGQRFVRWLTDAGGGTGCHVRVTRVTVPDGALVDLSATIDALVARGYDRPDRRYLLFADTDRLCGVATLHLDDRPGPDNVSNHATGYGRVDRPCWAGGDQGWYSVAAHELIHTLGAVQSSAPNVSSGHHCTDQWDTLCYTDGSSTATRVVCSDGDTATTGEGDHNNRLLDCGHDDYFHTAPPAGSYLATHWNTADSVFLARQTSGGTTTGGTGDGDAGAGTNDVTPDPQGRPVRWPQGDLGGAHRPLLSDAHGWEVCDLPVDVWAATGTASGDEGSSSLLGGALDRPSTVAPGDDQLLRELVRGAVGEINGAVGREVLHLRAEAWPGGTPSEGQVVVRWGDAPTGATHLSLHVADVRIRSGTVTLDPRAVSARSAAGRRTVALQAMSQLLGLGHVGGTGDLMAPFPPDGADRSAALAALRHLYDQPCDVDPRLSDTGPGHPSQRLASGVRARVDLAADVTSVRAAGLELSAWLRALHGDGWAQRAVICRDDVFADCLAGSALAATDGPVLLVPGGSNGRLPDAVAGELSRALHPSAELFVLGGPAAISERIVTELRQRLPGRSVQRLWGPDRYTTAVRVAHQVAADNGGSAPRVLLARADEPADAIAAGAAAARLRVPVLLTARDQPTPASLRAVTELGSREVLALGGEVAISARVLDAFARTAGSGARLAGRTRSETSVAIARSGALWDRTEVTDIGSVVALNGWHPQAWALALAAAPVAATLRAPVVFTAGDDLPAAAPSGPWPGEAASYLRDLPVRGGDPEVVSVFVGAGRWASGGVAESFHGMLLPGLNGNVELRRS